MKLRKKTTARQVKAPKGALKGFHPSVDDLGARYAEAKEKIKDADSIIDGVRDAAGDVIKNHGVANGNSREVKGQRYMVGITTVMSSPTLDEEGLRAFLKKKHPTACGRIFKAETVYVLDEAALIAEVEQGKIARTDIQKFTRPGAAKGERFNVTKL